MKYFLSCFVFALWFFSMEGYAQQQVSKQLSADMVDENGFLTFSTLEGWKYQPGDKLIWADPEFDDSDWHDLAPGGLSIEAMPDSLWNGYGWWRYTFTADSSFYSENWNLYFFGWGAAEVYLDGERIHQFGIFSVDQDQERTFMPETAVHPPVNIKEKDTHTFAVRYSHQQAKEYNDVIKVYAGNLGFGFGFGTHAINQYRAKGIIYESFTLFVSAAILFVLFLLHITLYYKFPEDRSNLFITVIVGLYFLSDVAIYSYIFLNLTNYWFSILSWTWMLSSMFAVLLLPYTVTEIFKLEKQKKALWLIAVSPLYVISKIYFISVANYFFLFITLVSFFWLGYFCWRAYKSGKRGTLYVAGGALGSLSLCVAYGFYVLEIFEISAGVFYVMVAFLYTLFPLGMTLYVANSYGYLFTSLESEIAGRTKKLKKSLEDLRATQSQLIQSEKMASLGELTAGIAHEIQNPLNFVNNFSDLNKELIEELKEAVAQNDQEEVTAILADLTENESKINHHGKRAENIVKSMLQHSRTSSGEKELTDINALSDEYLRLAYHGLRAKDKSGPTGRFNADFKCTLDETLPKVKVIPQDIGRVLLNLINNAFQATSEKAKISENGYLPTVEVITRKEDDTIEIIIKDNGPGISNELQEKIFQPFFTTKPAGSGTGLGLSLSYDIITKGHNGKLALKTEPGGTDFIITLPIEEK